MVFGLGCWKIVHIYSYYKHKEFAGSWYRSILVLVPPRLKHRIVKFSITIPSLKNDCNAAAHSWLAKRDHYVLVSIDAKQKQYSSFLKWSLKEWQRFFKACSYQIVKAAKLFRKWRGTQSRLVRWNKVLHGDRLNELDRQISVYLLATQLWLFSKSHITVSVFFDLLSRIFEPRFLSHQCADWDEDKPRRKRQSGQQKWLRNI